MYKVDDGCLLASLLKIKKKYFHEEYVTISELRQFEKVFYQKAKELDILIVCVSQNDLLDYFSYSESNGCYTIKEGLDLAHILNRFEGHLPFDILKLLYSDDFVLDLFIQVEYEELKEQAKNLERRSLILKQLELSQNKDITRCNR